MWFGPPRRSPSQREPPNRSCTRFAEGTVQQVSPFGYAAISLLRAVARGAQPGSQLGNSV